MNNIQLHQLNQYHLAHTGGLNGFPLNDHKLMWITVTLKDSEMFGINLYPTDLDKATFLVCNLIQGHCFQDANKRTGISALFLYLWTHGYTLKTREGKLESLAVAIAKRTMDSDEVKKWIKRHLVKLSAPYTWDEAWETLDTYADTWERLAKL